MEIENWTSDKLFLSLIETKSEKSYWDKIKLLRSRPTNEIFRQSLLLTRSGIKKEKIIGIDILAQLGVKSRPYRNETLRRFFELLDEETDPDILRTVLISIGHNKEGLDSQQIEKISSLKSHEKVGVRKGVTMSLLGLENKIAIETLIGLMRDKSSDIRNWASFGVGSQIDTNTQEIIDALWERTTDGNEETRLEAIVGLSRRNFDQVKERIKFEIENSEYGTLLFEAIEHLGDISFISILETQLEETRLNCDVTNEWKTRLEECIRFLKAKNDA